MKVIKMIPLILIMLLLSGCWDKIEIEDLGYVAVIGLDEDINNRIRVTFLISNPQVGTSTTVNVNEPASDIITLSSQDILSAVDLSSISSSRRLTFSHARVLIVSEKLAKSDKIFSLVEAIQRDRDIRREVDFIVCKENASDFIRNNNPPMETRPSKYYEFMTSRWKDTGFVPLADLHRFSQRTIDNLNLFLSPYATAKQESPKTLAENEGDYLAGQVDKRESNPTQMMGSTVFKRGQMIGKLTGDETRMALMLRPKKITNNILVTFPDPLKEGERISARLIRKKTKINIDIENEYPVIKVTVPVQISITAIPSFVNYVDDLKNQEILKDSIKDYLEDKAMKLVKKTQKEFGAEPFLWATAVREKFWLYKDFEEYNWMKKYSGGKVTVNFDVQIKDFGKHIAPPKVRKEED